MSTSGETDGQRNRLDWRGRLSGVFLGTAGGMGINVLSNDVGYRGVAAAAGVGAVLSAASWLRALPPQAPLVRYAARGLLTLALIGAVVAAFGPTSWAAYATLAATALAVTSVLLSHDAEAANRLLGGAASIGAGVAGIGLGIALVTSSRTLAGAATICIGVGFIGGGIALMTSSRTLLEAATICIGVGLIGVGLSFLNDNTLAGAAIIGVGMGATGSGLVNLVPEPGLRERLRRWATALVRDPAEEKPQRRDSDGAPIE
ncbi:hypothetical protein [Micromonospora sp. NPDC002717]|uniref:hypothetical protein n=1 Tax=Micromonospora sp. NPDC002717 TaxID=3154424 RepID=UPI0033239F8F